MPLRPTTTDRPEAATDASAPAGESYLAPTARRRLATATLAVAMAVFVTWLMLRPPTPVPPAVKPEPPRCAQGQDQNCVGGRAQVIVAPAPPANPRR